MAIRLCIACVIGLALPASACAHDSPFKGEATLITNGPNQNGVYSFDVKGRVAPLGRVTGNGRFTYDPATSTMTGVMTMMDHNGDELDLSFEADGFSGTFLIHGGTGQWSGHVGDGKIKVFVGDLSWLMKFDGAIGH